MDYWQERDRKSENWKRKWKRNNKKGIDRDERKTLLYWKQWTNRLTQG